MSMMIRGLSALMFLSGVAWADDVDVIVGFHGKADPAVFERLGGAARGELESAQAWAGRVPAASLRALRGLPGVAYVEEDAIGQGDAFVPNDPKYGIQSDEFNLIRSPGAWSLSTGAGVRVAVLDSGCQLSHPDIGSGATGKVKVWRNFIGGSVTDVADPVGHGTHTAGTVGARMNNGIGVAAAGFNCELAIGRVLDSSNYGYYSWFAAGIDWASASTGARAKVISMSLSGATSSTTLLNAVNTAWNRGVLIVAAAGNNANSTPRYPASYTNCISVAATTSTGTLASFSNYGSTVDLAAPGVNVYSTYKGSAYAYMNGTSMATPHVAGTAALVWASKWGTSATSVRSRLQSKSTQAVTGANAGTLKVLNAQAAVGP